MNVLSLNGVRILGIHSCVPSRGEDSLARCTAICGDAEKARNVVRATGIVSRRIADPGTSSLDLCVAAARSLLEDCRVAPDEIGAVIAVTFTPERMMPCNACQAQGQLGLPTDLVAFDIGLACSGWVYGLHAAATYAKATGKKVLLLDGDVQTPRLDPEDAATVPLMADAGTATLLAPDDAADEPWRFAFLSDGGKGDALSLPVGGKISMDGFGVFRFVTADVVHFIRDFLAQAGIGPDNLDAFVPHQANVYMVRQMAKGLGFPGAKLWISGDTLGNSSSASVPTTIAACAKAGAARRLLVSGFGGGLSAAVGVIDLPASSRFRVFDYGAPA